MLNGYLITDFGHVLMIHLEVLVQPYVLNNKLLQMFSLYDNSATGITYNDYYDHSCKLQLRHHVLLFYCYRSI